MEYVHISAFTCILCFVCTYVHAELQRHPVNVRDNCGWTPLHEAANNNHYAIVEALLEAGADINDRGGIHCNGITPLIDAASCGNLEIIQLLVDMGANVLAEDSNVSQVSS